MHYALSPSIPQGLLHIIISNLQWMGNSREVFSIEQTSEFAYLVENMYIHTLIVIHFVQTLLF